jgi:hypothetical protein
MIPLNPASVAIMAAVFIAVIVIFAVCIRREIR